VSVSKRNWDWRAYVEGLLHTGRWGFAAGLGYFASKVFIPRTTPIERIVGSIEKVRDSLGGLLAGAVRPGLIKVTLLGIATKAAAGLDKECNPYSRDKRWLAPGLRPQTGRDSTINPRVDT